jgi:hypothetical protein
MGPRDVINKYTLKIVVIHAQNVIIVQWEVTISGTNLIHSQGSNVYVFFVYSSPHFFCCTSSCDVSWNPPDIRCLYRRCYMTQVVQGLKSAFARSPKKSSSLLSPEDGNISNF